MLLVLENVEDVLRHGDEVSYDPPALRSQCMGTLLAAVAAPCSTCLVCSADFGGLGCSAVGLRPGRGDILGNRDEKGPRQQ